MYNIFIGPPHFEWDIRKAAENRRKHGVSFEEAKTAFSDVNAEEYPDPEHSDEEDRFILLGITARMRVVMVCHCFRQSGEVIRIISARKADKQEESDYWELQQ